MRVLIVDDNAPNAVILKHFVARVAACEPHCFSNGAEALAWSRRHRVDLALVDYQMPVMDGVAFLRAFRAEPGNEAVPVVIVTTNSDRAVRHEALKAGATDFLLKPIDPIEAQARLANLIALRQAQRTLEDQTAWLRAEVAKATHAVLAREQEMIVRLAKAVEHRDPETGLHVLRMAHYSRLIAAELGLPDEEQEQMFRAAPMHDIGKVGIPDAILLKPGKLDPGEFAIMRQHAAIGARILADSASDLTRRAAEIALTHHEKFDGSGYPSGLCGERIPLSGRIIAVADVFDALTSVRPYKPAWPNDRAVALLEDERGKHFDPRCVDAFLARWRDVGAVQETYRDPA